MLKSESFAKWKFYDREDSRCLILCCRTICK
jgi:hypothetical protein